METELSPAAQIEALQAQVQQLQAQEEATARRADETNDELIKNLNSLQERHSTLSDELSSTRQDLHDCQRRFEEIRQENIKLQQRQEESDAATVTLRREQASLQRTLESKEARLTAALSEAERLVDSNRKLIKEEANARTEAERARYEAAAAKATCEHAVQDRQLLEERLLVIQQRAKEADTAHENTAKQLRDANAVLSADCEQKVAEAARLQAMNTRLQADNEKLVSEVQDLKDKLREKEMELTSVFEACEAEKSAYEAARESADVRLKGEQERKLDLESSVRELTVLVEELKEREQERMKQLTVERDDALEVARKAEEHSRNLSTAARGGLLEAPSSGAGDYQQRAPLAPILGADDVDGNRGALMMTAPGSQERTYTSLMHELEVTKRKCREQAHELSQMSREYDEAMAILRARAVDLDVQRKQFNSMRSQHKALNASLAALADDKAAAEGAAAAARARAESAARHAALAAEAANDRARAMAALMVEVARLKGLPEPAREPVPFPNVAEMGGGVNGWDAEAQALVTDEKQMGTCTSVDAAIAMNMRLCASLRAVLVDANVQRTKLADAKENELVPQIQAKSKEVDSLTNILKEKDELMAQKQRQIDSLLAAIGARPAATGEGDASDSQRVAIERVKEKMKEEVDKLEAMHASHRNKLEEELSKSKDLLFAARSDATTKAAEAQYSNDRAAAAHQQVQRFQTDLETARIALSKAQEKLLETHQALADSDAEKSALRARTAAAEGDVEGARKAAAAAEASAAAAEERSATAQIKAAQAEGERLAAEKMLKALQTSFDSQSERLHKLMESRDEEAAGLRADVAAAKEELQQARALLADTSDKDKAERLEMELNDIRTSLKEKEAAIVQAKAEAAAAASVKEELERQVESLRRQLADAQAGTAAIPTTVSSDGTAAGAVAASAAGAASGAVRDAALLAAELRTTQVQLQHVMHERQAAQSLAEQHKSSAESLERHRDALHKTISELRSAKEEVEKRAIQEQEQQQAKVEALNKEIMELRTSTAAAEAKRMDAQRREQASIDEARRWRSDIEGLRDRLREQETAANREASEASAREAAIAAKHDSLTIQAGEYVQRIQALQRELTASQETLKAAHAEVREAREAARRDADTAAAEITRLTADLADARATGNASATGTAAAGAGTARTANAGQAAGQATVGSAGAAPSAETAVDENGASPAQDTEEARGPASHSINELRRLLREREADLRAAMGEAQAGRAQVRRLNTQLQAVSAQKEELRVAKVALEEKLAAPVLSESAQRQSVESTRQYETQRAANERLLEEKEALNKSLSKLHDEKDAVEQRLRNANFDLTECKKQLEDAKKDLKLSQESCKGWQQEALECVARYGSDDQKQIQSLKETVRNLEDSLKTAQADIQREKKAQEALIRDKARLDKELEGVKKELDTVKKADKPASRAPIQFSAQGAVPAAGPGPSGAVRGARVPSAQQTAKEKEDTGKEVAQLKSELAKQKELLAKANAELQSKGDMVPKAELDKVAKKREQLSKQVDRLGWAKQENLKVGEKGTKHKKSPKEFIDTVLEQLTLAKEAESKIQELNEQIAELEKASQESAEEISKLKEEISGLKSQLSTLKKQSDTQATNLKKRIGELETSLEAAQSAPAQQTAPVAAPATVSVPAPASTPVAAQAAAPAPSASATPTRAKRNRDEAATPDVPASDSAAAAAPGSPVAHSTPKKLKIVPAAAAAQEAATAAASAEPTASAAVAAAGATATDAGAPATDAGAPATDAGATATDAVEDAGGAVAAEAEAAAGTGATVDEEMEEEEEDGDVGDDGAEEEGDDEDKVVEDGEVDGDLEDDADAEEEDAENFEDADEEEDEAGKDTAATPPTEPADGEPAEADLAADGEEEAEDKFEQEGHDTAKEDGAPAPDAPAPDAATVEGIAAGTDELGDQADPGEVQNATTDAASKEEEQHDGECGNVQEAPETQPGLASAHAEKSVKKRVSKLAAAKGGGAAVKAKTRSQTAGGSEKGTGPKKKGKPAPIEFPESK